MPRRGGTRPPMGPGRRTELRPPRRRGTRRGGGGSWRALPRLPPQIQGHGHQQVLARLERPRVGAGGLVRGDHPDVPDVVPVGASLRVWTVDVGGEQTALVDRADVLDVVVIVRDAVLLEAPAHID